MHSINLIVNYLYRKYGVPLHNFFENLTRGTSHLNTRKLQVTFYNAWNTPQDIVQYKKNSIIFQLQEHSTRYCQIPEKLKEPFQIHKNCPRQYPFAEKLNKTLSNSGKISQVIVQFQTICTRCSLILEKKTAKAIIQYQKKKLHEILSDPRKTPQDIVELGQYSTKHCLVSGIQHFEFVVFCGKGFPADSRYSNGNQLCPSSMRHISLFIWSRIYSVCSQSTGNSWHLGSISHTV